MGRHYGVPALRHARIPQATQTLSADFHTPRVHHIPADTIETSPYIVKGFASRPAGFRNARQKARFYQLWNGTRSIGKLTKSVDLPLR